MKTNRPIFLTFIAIALPILLFGFFSVYFSVNRIHHQYIDLQLKSNSKTAKMISRLFNSRISAGEKPDSLLNDFQHAVEGSQADQGYLCIFDRETGTLIGHPNPGALGMSINTRDMQFGTARKPEKRLLYEAVATDSTEAGLLHVGASGSSEIVYMTPVEGTSWKLSVHENLGEVNRQLDGLQRFAISGFLILALVVSLLSTWIVYRINKRHKKEIAEKDRQIENQRRQLSVRY